MHLQGAIHIPAYEASRKGTDSRVYPANHFRMQSCDFAWQIMHIHAIRQPCSHGSARFQAGAEILFIIGSFCPANSLSLSSVTRIRLAQHHIAF